MKRNVFLPQGFFIAILSLVAVQKSYAYRMCMDLDKDGRFGPGECVEMPFDPSLTGGWSPPDILLRGAGQTDLGKQLKTAQKEVMEAQGKALKVQGHALAAAEKAVKVLADKSSSDQSKKEVVRQAKIALAEAQSAQLTAAAMEQQLQNVIEGVLRQTVSDSPSKKGKPSTQDEGGLKTRGSSHAEYYCPGQLYCGGSRCCPEGYPFHCLITRECFPDEIPGACPMPYIRCY